MVRRAVGTLVPWLGVCLVVYSCVEQSDAPPIGAAGKGGTATGGGAGRAQSGSGGAAQSGSGANDSAGAGATGAPPAAGTGGAGRAGAGRGGAAGNIGSSGGSVGGAGQTGAPSAVGRCDSPAPWSSNLVGCEGDYVHRPVAGACELPPRNGEAGAAGTSSWSPTGSCDTDADCGPSGYCVADRADAPQCVHGCREDADCLSGELCACVTTWREGPTELGVCVPADCSVDADCGAKSLCVSGLQLICVQGTEWWPDHFHCQSTDDECNGTFDCGEGGRSDFPPNPHCNYDHSAQHFVCMGTPGC